MQALFHAWVRREAEVGLPSFYCYAESRDIASLRITNAMSLSTVAN